MHTDSILEQWNIQGECNDIVNLCPDPFQLLVLGLVAVEQKYDPDGGGGGSGWRERLQSSRLSARSVHVRRSKIGRG